MIIVSNKFKFLTGIVQHQPEAIILNKKRITVRFQNKRLRKRIWHIVVGLFFNENYQFVTP